MDKINILDYSLSADEMMQLNPDALLITYDELNKIFDINDLFNKTKSNKIIILYLLRSRSYGHWTCLFKDRFNKINFYDSYGKPLDYHLDNLSIFQRIEYDELTNRLKELLEPHDVYFNNIILQGPHTKTCGMHVCHRLHNYHLTGKEYVDKMLKKDVENPDIYVAEYTMKLLNKI